MLPQECTTEDLMEYNEAAKECLPVDEQCVVTWQEEDWLPVFYGISWFYVLIGIMLCFYSLFNQPNWHQVEDIVDTIFESKLWFSCFVYLNPWLALIWPISF